MKKEKTTKTCTYIGGQAVMEGIMMRGKRSMATAVRDPEGEIQIESERLTPPEKRSQFPLYSVPVYAVLPPLCLTAAFCAVLPVLPDAAAGALATGFSPRWKAVQPSISSTDTRQADSISAA